MRPYLVIISFCILFFSCRKEPKHNYSQTSLELSMKIDQNLTVFNWTQVNTDDFVNYELYGANEPISEVKSDGSIDAELIFSTQKKSTNFFRDSTGITFGFKHYKLLVRLENSLLASNSVVDNETLFISEISTSSSFATIPIPVQKKVLFLQNGSQITASLYDYDNGEFIIKNKTLGGSSSFAYYKICEYNNKMALCNLYGNYNGATSLVIYDINSLAVLAAYPHPTINSNPTFTSAFFVKNNHLLYRGYESPYYKLVDWNLGNNTFSIIDSASTSTNQYGFASFSPKYIVKYRSNTDSLRLFNVAPDGAVTMGNKLTIPVNTFNGQITGGSKQLLISSTTNYFYDTNWQVAESFNTQSGNMFYLSESPNENYYAFQKSTFGESGIHIFKSGQKENIYFTPFFTNVQTRASFLDNDQFIFILGSISSASQGLLIKKLNLE